MSDSAAVGCHKSSGEVARKEKEFCAMAGPKSSAALALLLALSLVSFSLVAACTDNCSVEEPQPPEQEEKPPECRTEKCKVTPPPKKEEEPPACPLEKCKVTPPPKKEEEPPSCPLEKCKVPPQLPPAVGKCPIDTLKLGVCTDVLGGLLNVTLGRPPMMPCCGLLRRLVDLEAALCLCTALRANVLGIWLNLPVSLSLLLNYCGKKVPSGFICK